VNVDIERYRTLRDTFSNVRERQMQNAHLLDLEAERERLKHIRKRAIGHLDELWEVARERLEENGIRVLFASTREQAQQMVLDEVGDEMLVVKAKSNVSREVGVGDALSRMGIEVVETDLGDRILQLSGESTAMHPTGPISHMDRHDVAEVLSEHFGYDVEPEPEEMTMLVKGEVLDAVQRAKVGITGANAVCANEGCIVILHNEANVMQLMAHVHKHIVITGREKVYECLEDAMCMARLQTFYATGSLLPSYVEVISGPSKTADIEKQLFYGMYGPREVVLIVVDNGRSSIARRAPELLECVGCGSCLLYCSVYSVVGEQFSSCRGMGGIGVAKTGAVGYMDERLFYCTTCEMCEEHCPVSIDTCGHLLQLRSVFVRSVGELPSHHRIKTRILTEGRAFFDASPSRISALEGHLDIEAPTLLFVGCLSSARRQSGIEALSALLERADVPFCALSGERCCGSPMLKMGYQHVFERLASENIRMIERSGAKRVVFPCAGCEKTFRDHYTLDVELLSASELVLDLVEQGRLRPSSPTLLRVAYHIPCHLTEGERIARRIEDVLSRIPNVEVHIMEEGCCGAGGGVRSALPELAGAMASLRVEQARTMGADVLASSCPFCELNMGERGMEVLDIAELVERLTRASSGNARAQDHVPSD